MTDFQHHWRILKISAATAALSAVLAGCPREPPTPEPANPCGKEGQVCADPPAPSEGPPPVGTQAPRGAAR